MKIIINNDQIHKRKRNLKRKSKRGFIKMLKRSIVRSSSKKSGGCGCGK